ncbi:carbon monoxide dehydrogenase subunit G [Quadrisphaera sp. GCM10027208]|uniref:SRPBCC family protein n=1 Tax=Quadrisphaera sp. GCM10027208 TaxID=3273423 RepID=UPI0036170F6C
MKISGTATLSAPPAKVYEALNDPNVLVRTIPGVESLEQTGEDRYRMSITAGVASIKGTYDGEVALTDRTPPNAFTLKGKGAGAPGTVDASVRVTLAEQGEGTLLSYDADAVVGGMVGGVGQRMITGVAKKMAGQFFGNVDALLTGAVPAPEPVGVQGAPAPEAPAPTAGAQGAAAPAGAASTAGSPTAAGPSASAGAVFRAPAPAVPSSTEAMRVPFWIVLAGVGAGAFWALAGVLVGWRIARRR